MSFEGGCRGLHPPPRLFEGPDGHPVFGFSQVGVAVVVVAIVRKSITEDVEDDFEFVLVFG